MASDEFETEQTSNPPDAVVDAQPETVAPIVPLPLRVAGAWSWRIIVVGIVLIAIAKVVTLLSAIVLPLVIALLIAAPLERLVNWMHRHRIPRGLGAALSVLGLVTVVLGLAFAVGASVVTGFGSLRDSAAEGFNTLVDWLVEGPLHVSSEQINTAVDEVMSTVRDNAWGLASGAWSVTGTLTALIAGIVLALLSLFFFLRDGATIWSFFVRIAPKGAQASIDRAGQAGWTTLRRYTQTSVLVAFIDAVGIGTGAWILGVPLALPIAIAVFLFSFIPMFGAAISGALAVLVALVDGGWTTALLMLIIVLFVQQTEGNVLYPWLFGKAASVHPMAILLAVSSGTLLAGLAGAVIAVPILAFTTAFARGLHKEYVAAKEEPFPPITGQIPLMAERSREALRRARTKVTTSQIKVRKRRRR
ncbi:AI-2E family transporter [Demequina sp. TTPB684]|uniref:AI-2E family transporter n=1 Tax=unclassified Demequina TaxID=2620311 RepID=UPI001CF174E1|nr:MULTISPECIES: AI-2E family transporter [unclassified Demequina]MCB2412521.1 AI-2E family transporter [Demequina sp. TTPB684]UPU87356.1 AI-2E family transporter [Demequina sp. TMPB413]